MIIGALLVLLGPFIVYKTIKGMKKKHEADPEASKHWFSNGLNFLIAVVLFIAGILFIINNLRGSLLAA